MTEPSELEAEIAEKRRALQLVEHQIERLQSTRPGWPLVLFVGSLIVLMLVLRG
jgi:hypothetical protein